jgi:hypothetical protein
MSLSDGLKLAGNLFTTGLYGFKVVADIHKHGTHEGHHQLCDCMGYCTVCIYTNAVRKGKAKASA